MRDVDHYTNGRTAAEAGKPADSHGLKVGSFEHARWKRGHEEWLEENGIPDTVPDSVMAQELALLNYAELGNPVG